MIKKPIYKFFLSLFYLKDWVILNAIGNLWSICLGVNILIFWAICCLLRSRIFQQYRLFFWIFIFRNVFFDNRFSKINQSTINIIESTLLSCHIYTLIAQNRRHIWRLSECNWIRTHNHHIYLNFLLEIICL